MLQRNENFQFCQESFTIDDSSLKCFIHEIKTVSLLEDAYKDDILRCGSQRKKKDNLWSNIVFLKLGTIFYEDARIQSLHF